jgi:drug/metabolite transporter (DMT)-like permease
MSPLPDPQQLAASRTGLPKIVLFAILCVVWGSTWLAMKTSVGAVPPAFFAGTRWIMAGLVLVVWRTHRGLPLRIGFARIGRVAAVALLMIALNASLLLYGLKHVGSGLGAVITSGFTPLTLLGFGILFGEERFSWRQAGAIALGMAGLAMLFGPSAFRGELSSADVLGAILIILGCISYCAGSVLARPLMRSLSPAHVAAITNLIGGGVLLTLSLAVEPGSWHALRGEWGWPAWAGWFFLLLPSSLGATIIYFVLVRDWGASKAGTYAFVSPVIAVLLGVAVYGERLNITDAIGMVAMLAAAAIALRRVPR